MKIISKVTIKCITESGIPSHPEDKYLLGLPVVNETLDFVNVDSSPEDQISKWFHENYPVKVLDDFEFTYEANLDFPALKCEETMPCHIYEVPEAVISDLADSALPCASGDTIIFLSLEFLMHLIEDDDLESFDLQPITDEIITRIVAQFPRAMCNSEILLRTAS